MLIRFLRDYHRPADNISAKAMEVVEVKNEIAELLILRDIAVKHDDSKIYLKDETGKFWAQTVKQSDGSASLVLRSSGAIDFDARLEINKKKNIVDELFGTLSFVNSKTATLMYGRSVAIRPGITLTNTKDILVPPTRTSDLKNGALFIGFVASYQTPQNLDLDFIISFK